MGWNKKKKETPLTERRGKKQLWKKSKEKKRRTDTFIDFLYTPFKFRLTIQLATAAL